LEAEDEGEHPQCKNVDLNPNFQPRVQVQLFGRAVERRGGLLDEFLDLNAVGGVDVSDSLA
jgi:hypothetical protein